MGAAAAEAAEAAEDAEARRVYRSLMVSAGRPRSAASLKAAADQATAPCHHGGPSLIPTPTPCIPDHDPNPHPYPHPIQAGGAYATMEEIKARLQAKPNPGPSLP